MAVRLLKSYRMEMSVPLLRLLCLFLAPVRFSLEERVTGPLQLTVSTWVKALTSNQQHNSLLVNALAWWSHMLATRPDLLVEFEDLSVMSWLFQAHVEHQWEDALTPELLQNVATLDLPEHFWLLTRRVFHQRLQLVPPASLLPSLLQVCRHGRDR